MNQVRVIIIDDHAIWRGGLRSLLSGTEFDIIAEGVDGQDAVPLAKEHEADLLVADRRQFIRAGAENVVAGKAVLAAVGQVQQAKDIEQRAFARAGGAEDAATVAAGNGQAHIIENGQVLPGQLIALADALQGDQAWVRGGICHEYAFSLDAVVIVPGKAL